MGINLNSETSLYLDTNREITLGGLITLRQEGEIIINLKNKKTPIRIVHNSKEACEEIPAIWKYVFNSSKYEFQYIYSAEFKKNEESWPGKNINDSNFSYHSSKRIIELYRDYQIKPELKWKQSISSKLEKLVKEIGSKIICLHLRNHPPYTPETSNIDDEIWEDFLKVSSNSNNDIQYILLGNDLKPDWISDLKNIIIAEQILTLDEQLALISLSNGFIGMASGICASAQFSKTPYVIIKHPDHHFLEMKNELGKSSRFPFSNLKQQLWRTKQSKETLCEALNFVRDEWNEI